MKMANHLQLPIFQYVGDGDARFRNQMQTLACFVPALESEITNIDLETIQTSLVNDALDAGWILPKFQTFETFHFFSSAKDMKRSLSQSRLPASASQPFFPDPKTKVNNYLFLRCASDVFNTSAPIMGGLPHIATQDQAHWLRKLVKSSMLSCKHLRLGNYVVLFSIINRVYEMGAVFGLNRQDVDVNNKTDQMSSERVISHEAISAMTKCEWSTGTIFFVKLGKIGFEASWDPLLTPIQRMQNSYYVIKVFLLWKKWLVLVEADDAVHFITSELLNTSLMCSSLVQLSILFKLFFPEKPFMALKWAEYPLESYFSAVRLLFGHDDEFSALEYTQRVKKIHQQTAVKCK